MNIVLAIIAGYLLGSIPFAYMVSHLIYKLDLRKQGTGNVGTFNFVRVTGNKGLGLVVLILDMAKGGVAIFGIEKLLGPSYIPYAAFSLVVGHIFPLWLKFKGGRGLAVLGGIFLYLNFYIFILWGLLFTTFYVLLKKHLLSTILALGLINFFIPVLFNTKLLFISIPTTLIVILKYVSRVKSELKEEGVPDGA